MPEQSNSNRGFTEEELKFAKALTEAANGEKSKVIRTLYTSHDWTRSKIQKVLTEVHYPAGRIGPKGQKEVRYQHVQNVTKGLKQGKAAKAEVEVPATQR
jgi:hypothetical protein